MSFQRGGSSFGLNPSLKTDKPPTLVERHIGAPCKAAPKSFGAQNSYQGGAANVVSAGGIFLRHQTKPKDRQAPTLVDRHLGAP